MRVLVGWDLPAEAETIGLVLNVGDHAAEVFTDPDAFARAALDGGWDAALLPLSFPNEDDALSLFERLREALPDTPLIGAWRQGEIVRLARFIALGLHANLSRDAEGEFVFLLPTILEAAHTAAMAQRARLLAEKLREEVDSVRRLQESVIPHDLPRQGEYTLAARYEPSQIRVVGTQPVVMAGGDYYDAFDVADDQMILLVGDASGHGVKACMSIMTMHTLIRMIRSQRYPSTVEFVSEVNRRLCESAIVSGGGGFITLLYATLNTRTHELRWTSAGHPAPILHDLATGELRTLGGQDDAGLPLGVDEDAEFGVGSCALPPRARVLLYSDGLEEAFPNESDDEVQFGQAGIYRTLAAAADLTLEEALDRLFADSYAFTRGRGRLDDTSVLLIERRAGDAV